MKHIIKGLLFVVILLFSLYGASAIDCCIPPFPGFGNDGIIANEDVTEDYCVSLGNYVYVENCVDEGTGEYQPPGLDAKACCCAGDTYIDFGASSVPWPPYMIYEQFCANTNVGGGDFQPTPPDNGQCVCEDVGQTSMHQVTGYVHLLNDTPSAFMLPNIIVMAENGFYIDATSDEDGFYDLGEIPGVDNGFNVFSANDPEVYSVDLYGDGNLVELDCEETIVQEVLSGDYDDDVQINFTMNCEILGEACQPNWSTSDWGECEPYGGFYVRFRDVWDENNCGTDIDKPEEVLLPGMEGYDCTGNYQGNCQNGVLDLYEQCDFVYDDEGNWIETLYLDPITGNEVTNPPNCEQLGLSPDTENVGCTQLCSYDYANCQDTCQVCNPLVNPDVCEECPLTCEGNPLCPGECTSLEPWFLQEDLPIGVRESERNVYVAYTEGEINHPGLTIGVFYTDGTSDVEVRWTLNDTQAACINELQGFEAIICEESLTENQCIPSKTTVLTVENQPTETGYWNVLLNNYLLPNTRYCYNVCSIDNADSNYNCSSGSGEADKLGSEDYPLACFITGDDVCMGPHEQGLNCVLDPITNEYVLGGCSQEEYYGLDLTNLSLIQEPCDGVCVETVYAEDGFGAACINPGQCEICNGLFGMYAGFGLDSFYGPEDDPQTTSCVDFEFDPEDPENFPEPESQVGLCYKDKTLSIVDRYEGCEEVKTCYDYLTQNACEKDPCFRFTNISGNDAENSCSWKIYDEELNIGVCAPAEEDEEDCTLCDYKSPTGFCDEDMCSLYGSCYFKETQNNNYSSKKPQEKVYKGAINSQLSMPGKEPYLSACIHERDMSCFFYGSQEDCEGGVDLTIATGYDDEYNPYYGNNELVLESNDTYGFGKCEWYAGEPGPDGFEGYYEGCQKNSDAVIRFNDEPPYFDDCFEDGSSVGQPRFDCLRDVTNPTTTVLLRDPTEHEQYESSINGEYLPVYGLGELDEITISASDDVSSSNDVETKVSFVSYEMCSPYGCYPSENTLENYADPNIANSCANRGCILYPNNDLMDYVPGEGDPEFIEDTISHGEHLMIFFSKDEAKNLEVFNVTSLFIDKSGPEMLNFDYEINSFNQGGDIYFSNLSIQFNISEPAFCIGQLYTIDYIENTYVYYVSGDIYSYGESFNTTYYYLPDGLFYYNLTCFDDFDNDLVFLENITVEGNKAITNPLPLGGVFRYTDEVTLHIESYNDANCRLDEENYTYEDSRVNFALTGEQVHESDFTVENLQPINMDPTESKPYVFFTSCEFDNGSVTQQLASDSISFTIDQLAPEATLFAQSDLEPALEEYEASEVSWYYERDFMIDCDDYNSAIPIEQFGCQDIKYCFASGMDLDDFTFDYCESELYVVEDNQTDMFTVNYLDWANKHIYYQVTDTGGNVAEMQRENMKLRNIEVGNVTIYILDED